MEATEKVLDVGEFRINFASAGNGAPLLLLHGSEPQESWHVWEPVLAIGDTYRLIAPDFLGYGRSTRPEETPDFRAQAQMLRDFVEKLGIQKLSLMGSGWGGQVALEFALDWPDSVGSIVLVACSYDKDQLRRLQNFRAPQVMQLARSFLSNPEAMVSEPPEMENELKGMELRKKDEKGESL